jgi:type VI secretion system protein ImpG
MLGIIVDSQDTRPDSQQQALAENPPMVLPPDVIRPVGFGRYEAHEPTDGSDPRRAAADHALLPRDARSFRGYLLLTEFFAFPQKFLFVELTHLRRALSRCGREVSLYFLLGRTSADLARTLDKSTLVLGATPMINLFERKIDRLELTNQQSEVLVEPDPRSRGGVSVFAIDRVEAVTPEGAATEFQPFYSFKHAAERDRQRTFWHAAWRRDPSRGTADHEPHAGDYWLSLVDLDLSPATLSGRALRIETTCYNGDRPAHLPQGRDRPYLDLSGGRGPVAEIRCLRHPTRSIRPPEGYGAVWRLISQLSLNHLSLVGGSEAATALQEILLLHDTSETAASMIREGIRSVECRTVTRPLGRRIGGIGRGLSVSVMLDEKAFAHRGAYLFGSVLSHFLGQYVTINSFTELEIQTLQRRGREEPWKWPIRSGERPLA